MKVSKIVMNGFGKFNDTSFDIQGPLIMFYGDNEAGKSTIMGFIRSILFGFPTRKHMKDRYEPLHGGLHGGMIILTDHKGNHYRIERYDGVGSVTLDDGTKLGEDYLHQLLGGITSELFQNLFAFSLDELHEINSLQSDEISGYLFNAGTGAGAGTILDAEKKISQEMEQLYKPRGKNQDIQRLLKELEETRLELQTSKESLGQFNQKGEAAKAIDDQIIQQEQQIQREKVQLNWIEKCTKTHDSWMKLVELQRERDELPRLTDFPEDALNRFEKLAADQDRLLLEANRKQAKIKDLEQKRDQFEINHELLEINVEIENKIERLSSYQDAKVSLVEIQIELENTNDELSRVLRQIDKEWTTDDLSEFSTSISDREKVIWFRERLSAQLKDEEHSLQELHRINQQELVEKQRLVELEETLRKLELYGVNEFPWLIKRGWQELKPVFSDLSQVYSLYKKLITELNHLKQRHSDLMPAHEKTSRADMKSTQKTSTLKRKYIGITLALNALIPAYFLLEGQWSAAVISFVMASAFNGLFYMMTRNNKADKAYSDQNDKLISIEAEINAAEQQIEEQGQELQRLFSQIIVPNEIAAAAEAIHLTSFNPTGFKHSYQPVDISDKTMIELANISEALQLNEVKRQQAAERVEQHKKEYMTLLEQKEQIHSKVKHASQMYKHTSEEWDEWLQAHHLRSGLAAETVIEIFQMADQGLQLLSRKDKHEAKLRSLREYTDSFDQEVKALLKLNSEVDTVISLRQGKVEVDKHRKLWDEKRIVEKQMSEQMEEYQTIRSSLSHTEQKISHLWQEAGTEDEKQFRLFARYYNRELQLEEEKRHIEVFLDNWVGQEHRKALDKELKEKDLDQLQQESQQLQDQIAEQTKNLNDLREHRGKLQNEIEQLKSGQHYTEKQQRFEEQTASFQHLTGQWAARALCLQLFKNAKEVYEREKQPGVLKKASEYFASISDQQFRKVMAPIGEKRILVERATGEVVDTAFLSRGTAEQLYLAMRFALADEYAARISLPMVMDDIFVNFDQTRLQNTIKLLKTVSKQQQMIMFTCHPHVREAVTKLIPEVQQIHIQV